MKETSRISDVAVAAKTGRTWSEWFDILDAAGAESMSHKDIVAVLTEYQVGDWWEQMVAVGYEQDRGLRDRHEKPSGYEVSVSKTIDVPVGALFQAWADDDARRRWLGEEPITIRKATPGKSLRITWGDRTHVSVDLYAKGPSKSQVTVQHGKLPDADAAARMKAYWSEASDRLRQALAG